jgi:hypothetical protein
MSNERALLPEDRRRSKSTRAANCHAWPRVQHHLPAGATHANVATSGLWKPHPRCLFNVRSANCCCERMNCRWSSEAFAPPRTSVRQMRCMSPVCQEQPRLSCSGFLRQCRMSDSTSDLAVVEAVSVVRQQCDGLLTVVASSSRTAASSVSELTLSTRYGRRTKPYLAVRFQDAVVIHSRSVASGQLWPRMATHCTSEAALHAGPVQVAYGSRMHSSATPLVTERFAAVHPRVCPVVVDGCEA